MLENPILLTSVKLLSAALNDKECPDFDKSLWPAVKNELLIQGVFGIVIGMLLKSNFLDKEEKKSLMKINAAYSIKYFQILKQQTEAVNLLTENHIAAVVLKGTACAQYYDSPRLRLFGDIDLLVLPEDYDRALELFSAKGYTQLNETDECYQRHVSFATPSDIDIELHRFFSDNPLEDRNPVLDRLLFRNFSQIERIQLQQFALPVLASAENGIVILGHIRHHLKSGLGLRQIVDWMMYVKSQLNDDFWHKQFREMAETVGLSDLAKIVTKMCQMYLGLNADITWCQDADEKLADKLMLFVINNGNLGYKATIDKKHAYAMMRNISSIRKVVSFLTKEGMRHMQEAGYRPNKTLAWAYQLGHIFKRFMDCTDRKKLWRDMQKAKNDAYFFDCLNKTNGKTAKK